MSIKEFNGTVECERPPTLPHTRKNIWKERKATKTGDYITCGMYAPLFTALDHHPAVVWDG